MPTQRVKCLRLSHRDRISFLVKQTVWFRHKILFVQIVELQLQASAKLYVLSPVQGCKKHPSILLRAGPRTVRRTVHRVHIGSACVRMSTFELACSLHRF